MSKARNFSFGATAFLWFLAACAPAPIEHKKATLSDVQGAIVECYERKPYIFSIGGPRGLQCDSKGYQLSVYFNCMEDAMRGSRVWIRGTGKSDEKISQMNVFYQPHWINGNRLGDRRGNGTGDNLTGSSKYPSLWNAFEDLYREEIKDLRKFWPDYANDCP